LQIGQSTCEKHLALTAKVSMNIFMLYAHATATQTVLPELHPPTPPFKTGDVGRMSA
jgi:hypothetical protein